MSLQPNLFQSRRPAVSETDVAQLVSALRGNGWRLRRDLERGLGWTERKIRAVAEASHGEILGSDLGYRLTIEASCTEIEAWDARFAGQIQAMQARRAAVRKVRNRHIDLTEVA